MSRRGALRSLRASVRAASAPFAEHLRTVRPPGRSHGPGFAGFGATALAAAWALPRAEALLQAAKPASAMREGAVGLALAHGVDASPYTSHYVLTVAGSVFLWMLCYVLLRLWESAPRPGVAWRLPLAARHRAAMFCAFSVLCGVLALVRQGDGFTLNARLLLLAAGAAVLHGLLAGPTLSQVPSPRLGWLRHLLVGFGRWRVLPAALTSLLLVWPFVISLVTGAPPRLGASAVASVLLAWLASAWLGAHSSRVSGERRRLESRLLAAAVPLVWLPSTLFLGNEVQFRLHQFGPLGLARLLAAALLLAAAFSWWWTRRRVAPSARRILTVALLPSAVVQMALIRLHRHDWVGTSVDLFHRGEQVVPTQQLFQFGKIPFFDLRPVHGLSDMLFQSLYALLNGAPHAGAETLVWASYMPDVLALVLAYGLLSTLFGPLAAFLFTVVVPVNALLPSYYAMIALVGIALALVLRRPSRSRYLLLMASLLWLAAWRLDFGLAALPAVAGVLLVRLLLHPGWRSELRAMRRSLAVAAGLLTVLVAAGTVLASRPLLQSLGLFVHSYLVRSGTRARPNLFTGNFDVWVALQYYLLPGIGVVAVLLFAQRSLLRGRLPSIASSVVAFLAATSLVLSTRALERHTLVENFSPFLFLLVACLLPLHWRARRSALVLALVLGLFGVRMLFTAPPLQGTTGHFAAAQLVPQAEANWFTPRTWREGDLRWRHDRAEYAPLLRFLARNLEPGQTFYDFSEAPLLYAISGREFPTYLIPALEHTGRKPQIQALADLERLRRAERLPLVVFRQGLHNDFGTNGGPAEVRLPHLTQWIYRHYEPAAMLGTFDVWVERGKRVETGNPAYPLLFRRAAERVSVHLLETSAAQPYQYEAFGEDPYIHRVLRWAEAPPEDQHIAWALRLRLASSAAGAFEFFWRHGDDDWSEQHRFAVPVRASGESASIDDLEMLEVAFPITRRWQGKEISSLRIDPPPGAKFLVESAALVGVETFSGRERVPQFLDLNLLAWVAANLDAEIKLEELETVASPSVENEVLQPDSPLLLCRPEGVSPWQATHLLIRGAWDPHIEQGIPVSPVDVRPPHLRPPRRGRIYGTWDSPDRCCGFAFDLYPEAVAGEVHDYLVPLTVLWRWVFEDAALLLQSNVAFDVQSVRYVHLDEGVTEAVEKLTN